MSHERDPAETRDARLDALYREHGASSEMPSAAMDARILAMARDAVLRPAVKLRPSASGWRSALGASWFGPGLAFATLASLSVVIVALMPKEDISVEERATVVAPDSAVVAGSAAVSGAARKPDVVVSDAAPAATMSAPARSESRAKATDNAPAPGRASSASTNDAGNAAGSGTQAKAKLARANEVARQQSRQDVVQNAAPVARDPQNASKSEARDARESQDASKSMARDARGPLDAPKSLATDARESPDAGQRLAKAAREFPPAAQNAAPSARESSAATVAPEKSLRRRAESASDAEPRAAAPNPFPLVQPPASAKPPAPPASAAADAAQSQRQDRPSLLSEPTESRMANQPVPEVHDSAPTYPNESRPSLPLPYTYTLPRAPARDAAQAGGGATGALAGRAMAPQQSLSATTRKEEALERRLPERPGSSMAAAPATMLAAALPPRDPVQWIRDIQKLRAEGKTEQVTKELAEFRKLYPQYPLPDELKNLK